MKTTEVTIRYGSVKKQSDRIGVSIPTYYRGMNKGILPKGKLINGRRIIPDHLVDEAMMGGEDNE